MSTMNPSESAEFLSNSLRLRTFPIAAKFFQKPEFPEKTRRPGSQLGKRITICQAVTMARSYGWQVGLTREDLICVPAMISFGFTDADQIPNLRDLQVDISFSCDPETALNEVNSMHILPNGKYPGILLAPLAKAGFEPDTVLIYANPAQVTRLIQAWSYMTGQRVGLNSGGKVECTEYLISPFTMNNATTAIPGNGDRIFSMTQDDEMVFALPGSKLHVLIEGLQLAGKKLGARYPITFYQNFEPDFPEYHKALGRKLGLVT